jgi:AraC-like DNA-binding protein
MDDRSLVVEMVAYLERHLTEPLTAEGLAERSGYSLNRLRQKFFTVTGDTPSGYLRKRRLTEAAKEILAGTPIVETALRYGYSSQDNFTTAFRSFFGVTPAEIARIEAKYRRFIRTLREAYSIMEIANLKQPCYNATLMGCLKGASDYFDNDLSPAMLYGLTGHAFLINVHKDLCPSGPYVWRKDRFLELLEGQGIRAKAEYEITREATPEERARLEATLKEYMEKGDLFMLDFLEHQLSSGFDEHGFLMLKPWSNDAASQIPSITFGTWAECLGTEGWAHVTVLERAPRRRAVLDAARDALSFALELYRAPERHEVEGYRIGYGAYHTWMDCIGRGMGGSQGDWWGAMVWKECRWFAAEFFAELAELADGVERTCAGLHDAYAAISESLGRAGERSLGREEKLGALAEALDREREAEAGIAELLGSGALGA